MRIVQITPGSGGGFYCENCLRDIALVRAMRKLGHDVIMAPLYLPLQARPQGVSPSGVGKSEPVCNAPIFFGGVNVYLQQKLSLFRKTPRWIDRQPVVPRARFQGKEDGGPLGERKGFSPEP